MHGIYAELVKVIIYTKHKEYGGLPIREKLMFVSVLTMLDVQKTYSR